LIGALLSRADARGIGFSRLISVGNEVDLKVGEVADLLVDDPKTKAILLFMETLRDGERLAPAARRAHAAGQAGLAYKLGRSEIGQELAKSHTGRSPAPTRPSTPSAVATASPACRCSNRWSTCRPAGRPATPAKEEGRGKRVAVATTTGGGAAMVVDNMAVAGLDIVGPPQALVDWLKPLGIAAGRGQAGRSHAGGRQAGESCRGRSSGCSPTTATTRRSSSSAPRRSSIPSWRSSRCCASPARRSRLRWR
jgi:hypothetical protein